MATLDRQFFVRLQLGGTFLDEHRNDAPARLFGAKEDLFPSTFFAEEYAEIDWLRRKDRLQRWTPIDEAFNQEDLAASNWEDEIIEQIDAQRLRDATGEEGVVENFGSFEEESISAQKSATPNVFPEVQQWLDGLMEEGEEPAEIRQYAVASYEVWAMCMVLWGELDMLHEEVYEIKEDISNLILLLKIDHDSRFDEVIDQEREYQVHLRKDKNFRAAVRTDNKRHCHRLKSYLNADQERIYYWQRVGTGRANEQKPMTRRRRGGVREKFFPLTWEDKLWREAERDRKDATIQMSILRTWRDLREMRQQASA